MLIEKQYDEDVAGFIAIDEASQLKVIYLMI